MFKAPYFLPNSELREHSNHVHMVVSSTWHEPGNMRSVAMDWDAALEWDTALTQTEPTVVGMKKKPQTSCPSVYSLLICTISITT